MTVMILHPTEELKLINFQKEVIEALFENDRILFASAPLWIELGDFELTAKNQIKRIEIGSIEFSEDSIYSQVLIENENGAFSSKLTLVCLHKGRFFSDSDKQKLAQIKMPVRQLKVFRLGIVQEEGACAKSISKSVWCKLK